MRKNTRILALLMAFAMMATMLSGCKKNEEPTDVANTEKVLKAGSMGNFGATNLDPADDWNGWFLSFYGVAETLFKQSNSYDAEPCLVASYEEPTDGVTWKLTLRDDVTFSNGEKMTAQSVVDCFNRTFEVNTRGKETLNVTSMSADGQVLTLVTPEPDPTFLYSLCDPLLAVYYVGEDVDYDNKSYCTGPFIVEKFTAQVEADLVKNEKYWGGAPKIDKAILYTYVDEDAMVLSMQKGELDWIDGTSSAVKSCTEAEGFKIVSVDTSRADKIIFNHDNNVFGNDATIREVIALAIDREGNEKLCNGVSKANWGIYPTALSYGDNSKLDIKIKAKDLKKAEALLDEAGYKDTDGDGIREINGTPISLQLITTTNNTDAIKLSDVFASDLKTIGIELKTATYENLDSFDTYKGIKWDLCVEGKYMTPTGNGSYFFDQDVTTEGSQNYGHYSNAKIDELNAKLHKTFGDADRNAIIFEMEQILLDDNSFIVYANGTNTYVTSSRLTGYTPCPSNYYFLDNNMSIDG